MARGPKKHLKLLRAPKAWMLSKLAGTWAPRPSEGPHKLRESIPLTLILRNRLKYALTRREVNIICQKRLIRIDGKVRTDMNYPIGIMDVVSIDNTDERFRVMYDVKGRFALLPIDKERATFKLARVQKVDRAKKASAGRVVGAKGFQSVVPYLATHDGRTIRFPDPVIRPNDTIKVDLATNKIIGHLKFEIGNLALVTKGANVGRVGHISSVDRHPGSFDIVHLKDAKGNTFATRLKNVFIIADQAHMESPLVMLPKQSGIKYTVLQERERRAKGIKD